MSPILQSLANGSARGYGAFFGAAAAGAYESIASATGTGSSQNITFSSIPSTYQHLQIRGVFRTDRAAGTEDIRIRFNSDSGTNYSNHFITSTGASVALNSDVSSSQMNLGRTTAATTATNIIASYVIDIYDYTSTSKYKTFRAFGGYDYNSGGNVYLSSGLWMSSSALTSITFNLFYGNWTSQTQIGLYGIKGSA